MNVACAYPNCSNPVTGQCTGYKQDCRRFYCNAHSSGGFCFKCAAEKEQDDTIAARKEAEAALVEERTQIADALFKEVSNKRSPNAILLLAVSLLLMVFSCNIGNSGSDAVPFAVLMFAVAFGLLLAASYIAHKYREAEEKAQLSKITATRPDFADFYKEYKKKRQRDQMLKGAGAAVVVVGILASLGALLAGVVGSSGSAAADMNEQERIRREVRREMDRRGK